MKKYTLLELVHSVLISINGDEVNTWDETTESQSVAYIIRDAYYGIISRLDAPEHMGHFELQSTNADTPTLMKMPNYVASLKELKYNNAVTPETSPLFKQVWPLTIDEFFDRMHTLSTHSPDVSQYTYTTSTADQIEILYVNNKFPEFYTSIEDEYVLFDSIFSDEDVYLVKNKSQAFGQFSPPWSFDDDFVPDLDGKQFQILLNEAKSQAGLELKQMVNQLAERNARRHWIGAQRSKEAIQVSDWWNSLPNYGRRRR